jgi:hypothetical protein
LDEEAISAKTFHEEFRIWNSPETYQFSSWVSIGDRHWALDECIAHGDFSDVYTGQRARWPTELVLLKFLRDHKDIDLFENEWDAIQALHGSDAPGADEFTTLIPQPIIQGDISSGSQKGKRVSIFRWIGGFHHTLDEVIQAYPKGIPPRASIWMWRRILEVLTFIHASGMIHGAVLPPHLLVQENEHGMRLVGYSCCGRTGKKVRAISKGFESFYPQEKCSKLKLSKQLDLAMSARCIATALGGDPESGSLPKEVPALLAKIVQRVAQIKPTGAPGEDAWNIREELGEMAEQVYGPPQFIPIVMPS